MSQPRSILNQRIHRPHRSVHLAAVDRLSPYRDLAAEDGCVHLPTEAKSVYDVTGAGDMVLAALAAAWLPRRGVRVIDASVPGTNARLQGMYAASRAERAAAARQAPLAGEAV